MFSHRKARVLMVASCSNGRHTPLLPAVPAVGLKTLAGPEPSIPPAAAPQHRDALAPTTRSQRPPAQESGDPARACSGRSRALLAWRIRLAAAGWSRARQSRSSLVRTPARMRSHGIWCHQTGRSPLRFHHASGSVGPGSRERLRRESAAVRSSCTWWPPCGEIAR